MADLLYVETLTPQITAELVQQSAVYTHRVLSVGY
jgi:hypothetical protein